MGRVKTPKLLQFFEFERVTYKGKWNHEDFKDFHFQAFESYYLENPDTPFFELIPNGVRFKQYVGVIQIGKTTVEVLPKAGKENNKEIWQSVLLDMLKACHLLTAKNTGTAQLRLKSNSLLHLYFELFLNEVELLIHRGLIKKYRKEQGQSKALKGSVLFSKHITKNIIHKERFFINKNLYDKDHLIHQIINETLKVIAVFSSESTVLSKLNTVTALFPETIGVKVTSNHFKKIPLSRKHIPYQKALLIAELILMNYRPDIKTGNKSLIALMFDMNKLWETFVLKQLQKHAEGIENMTVSGQESKKFIGNHTLRPDIRICIDNEDYIVDTKWKIPYDSKASVQDLRQMYAYGRYWETIKTMLLYPGVKDKSQKYRSFVNLKDYADDEFHQCKIGFVSVLPNANETGLNKRLADDIIALITA